MKKTARILMFLSVLMALLQMSSIGGMANLLAQWSPVMIVPGYRDEALPPYLIVDQNRIVHAFTSQKVEENRVAVVYSQWNKAAGWTTPVDILLSQAGPAEIYGAFLDKAGMVHVVYRGGEPRSASMYYSRALLANADFAPAWSAPTLIGDFAQEPGSAALAGDSEGNLVVIYAGNLAGSGVYAAHSIDAGASWSEPFPLYLVGDPEMFPFYLYMYTDELGKVHAVWSKLDEKGHSSEAFYASFDFSTLSWSDPFRFAEDKLGDLGAGVFGPTYPYVMGSGNTLVILYNANGGPATAGRPALWVRRSEDNGKTWSEPVKPFSPRVGLSGAHTMVVDSKGVIHVLFLQRIERTINGRYVPIAGLWHSELIGDQWVEPERLDLAGINGYDVRAVVSQGNTLLATWREDPGAGQLGVFYSFARLDAPELPVVPLPTAAAVSAAEFQPTVAASDASQAALPDLLEVSQTESTPSRGINTPLSLVIGTAPVAVLLAVLITRRLYSRPRH